MTIFGIGVVRFGLRLWSTIPGAIEIRQPQTRDRFVVVMRKCTHHKSIPRLWLAYLNRTWYYGPQAQSDTHHSILFWYHFSRLMPKIVNWCPETRVWRGRGICLLRPEPTQVEPDLKNSEQAAALLLALNGLGSEDTLSLSTLLLLARSTPAMYFLPAASSSSMPVLVVGRGPLGPL